MAQYSTADVTNHVMDGVYIAPLGEGTVLQPPAKVEISKEVHNNQVYETGLKALRQELGKENDADK